jgi:8-oxo-dGTP diphosphatase
VDFTEYDTRLAAYAVIVDDRGRILLTWYNGKGRGEPGWTLPGGGVQYAETLEEAVVREVREETGYLVDLDRLLATDSFTEVDDERPRPFKSVRVIYLAHIAGGSLGTLERDGTTDRAAWIPLNEALQEDSRTQIVDVAINAWHRSVRPANPLLS